MLQPLDVELNKAFKDRMRQKWIALMYTDDDELTKGGKLKRPRLSMATTRVKEDWEDIPAEIVKKSFPKTDISNSTDGAKDNHMWQDSGESASEETWDTNERLTQQE